MNIQKTFIGIIMAGLLASTAACGGGSDPAATATDASSTPTAASDQQIKDLEAQIADMQNQIDDLKSQLPDAGTKDTANTLLTLDALVGKWKLKSYVLTNLTTGQSGDLITAGYQGEIIISNTSTISTSWTDPQNNVSKDGEHALTIKDGKELLYQNFDVQTTISGDSMHWSTSGNGFGLEAEFIKE